MRTFGLVIGLVLMAGSAQAATLDVVGGQLMGASGVLVDGSLYDVQFVDGTCIDLYNGCDDVSDFTFPTHASALLASQALFDQVFLDGPLGSFDSDPELTNGCSSLFSFSCEPITPYAPYDAHQVHIVQALNYSPEAEAVGYGDWSRSIIWMKNLMGGSKMTSALWAPAAIVPEPSTGLLVSIGLTALAARRRSLRS